MIDYKIKDNYKNLNLRGKNKTMDYLYLRYGMYV